MKVTFWGVRGSIPQPSSGYITTTKYGGNTTCLTVEFDNHTIVFDAGTGINCYGKNCSKVKSFIMLFTHFHHDHVHGFPFFLPTYRSEKIFYFYSPQIMTKPLSKVIDNQFHPPLFPYRFENTLAQKKFDIIAQLDSIRLLDVKNQNEFIESFEALNYKERDIISLIKEFPDLYNVHVKVNKSQSKLPHETARIDVMENLAHPNEGSYIYKISNETKSVVFATDIEGKVGGSQVLIKFSKNVDHLIHDAQYLMEDYPKFQDFGHSTYQMACDHAIAANVKNLYLTHHDPWNGDEVLDKLELDAKNYLKENGRPDINVVVAKEGDTF